MRRVIYADTLVLLNTLVTFLILLSVRALSSVRTSVKRLIAAAFIGGAASLSALLPDSNLLISFMLLILSGSVVVFTAFFVNNVVKLLRCFFLFILMTFTYGGFMFFLSYQFPTMFVYRNGFGYFNLPFWSVLLITAAAYVSFQIIHKKCSIQRKTYRYAIELTDNGKTVCGTALLDSGHNVTDCYTGRPVVIAKESIIRQLLSPQAVLELKQYGSLKDTTVAHTLSARCIPVRTVGGTVLLPAFTCGVVTIRNEEAYYRIERVTLACSDQLPEQFDCDAIISEQLLGNGGI